MPINDICFCLECKITRFKLQMATSTYSCGKTKHGHNFGARRIHNIDPCKSAIFYALSSVRWGGHVYSDPGSRNCACKRKLIWTDFEIFVEIEIHQISI